ncbi:MAG: hypothetical protein NUV76_06180, partial [Candidatus Kuenenia sp.]|nr:hypothetical protein [Candidatus Kuenenia sp.]
LRRVGLRSGPFCRYDTGAMENIVNRKRPTRRSSQRQKAVRLSSVVKLLKIWEYVDASKGKGGKGTDC